MTRKVLVADDSRVFRALMDDVLTEDGWQVIEAATGREALDKALAQRPELLVLDGLMPLLSGFEVLGRLKQATPSYRPKVFIVTGVFKSRRWESEAKHDYAIDEYLQKPLEPEELLKVVRRHFPLAAAPSAR